MKRLLSMVLVVLLMFPLQGCSGIFGGVHRRELGEYISFLSDGEKEYLEYSVSLEYGYVEINADSYKLHKKDFTNTPLSEVDKETEVLLSGCALGSFGENIKVKEEYDYLSEQLFKKFDNYECFEVIILKNADNIYGAINCYRRTSGRSGNLLSNEDLDRSYLFNVEDKNIKIVKEMEETAVLAFNQSHYIAYTDKTLYSVSKESGKKIELCEDIWWDKGPTFYSDLSVYFVEDTFMICGNKRTLDEEYVTLIVGDMSGTRVETLIDNKKI